MEDNINVIDKLKNICPKYSDILGMVILFGSFSRREENDDSDVDLYIESIDAKMTTNKLCTSNRYREFRNELNKSFTRSFDVLAYGGKRDTQMIRKSNLWKEIEKDGVVIYDKRAKAV